MSVMVRGVLPRRVRTRQPDAASSEKAIKRREFPISPRRNALHEQLRSVAQVNGNRAGNVERPNPLNGRGRQTWEDAFSNEAGEAYRR